MYISWKALNTVNKLTSVSQSPCKILNMSYVSKNYKIQIKPSLRIPRWCKLCVFWAGAHKVSALIKLVQSERKFEKENLISFYSFLALQSGRSPLVNLINWIWNSKQMAAVAAPRLWETRGGEKIFWQCVWFVCNVCGAQRIKSCCGEVSGVAITGAPPHKRVRFVTGASKKGWLFFCFGNKKRTHAHTNTRKFPLWSFYYLTTYLLQPSGISLTQK